MSLKDRTGEFRSAVASLRSRKGVQQSARANGPTRHTKHLVQFTQLARSVGADITKSFTKLDKLTTLARSKSLFDDRQQEIQELTYIIKQDIAALNQQLQTLQSMQRNGKTTHNAQENQHSTGVVLSLQNRLQSMSGDFKSVLELRTENLKNQKERREQFSTSTGAQLDLRSSVIDTALSDELGSGSGDGSNGTGGMQSMAVMVRQDETYLSSRAEAVQGIESVIVELGGMMQQLAHMVSEQGEQVKRIDDNVDEMEQNVEQAHGELLKYFSSVSSDRWLMIKVFLVLIVFFIVFVLLA